MNITRMRHLANVIERHANSTHPFERTFDMSDWFLCDHEFDMVDLARIPDHDERVIAAKQCGFVGCAAGWQCILTGEAPDKSEGESRAFAVATISLDLDVAEAWVFFHGLWTDIDLQHVPSWLVVEALRRWAASGQLHQADPIDSVDLDDLSNLRPSDITWSRYDMDPERETIWRRNTPVRRGMTLEDV